MALQLIKKELDNIVYPDITNLILSYIYCLKHKESYRPDPWSGKLSCHLCTIHINMSYSDAWWDKLPQKTRNRIVNNIDNRGLYGDYEM